MGIETRFHDLGTNQKNVRAPSFVGLDSEYISHVTRLTEYGQFGRLFIIRIVNVLIDLVCSEH